MELLTREIAYTYRDRAKALPYNGMQDIGERRALRIELQERCGVTELEAVNIINGFHIDTYCMKYLTRAHETREETPEPAWQKRRRKREQYSKSRKGGRLWEKQKAL